MTTLNIRIDEKVKAQAAKTLASLGLDMSSAIKMFLNQVIVNKGLPFTPRQRTSKEIAAEWDREAKWAMKHGKSYTDMKELFDDLGIS